MIPVPQAAIDLAKRFEGFHRVPRSDPSVTPNGPPVVNTAFRFEFDLDAPILRAIGRRPYR